MPILCAAENGGPRGLLWSFSFLCLFGFAEPPSLWEADSATRHGPGRAGAFSRFHLHAKTREQSSEQNQSPGQPAQGPSLLISEDWKLDASQGHRPQGVPKVGFWFLQGEKEEEEEEGRKGGREGVRCLRGGAEFRAGGNHRERPGSGGTCCIRQLCAEKDGSKPGCVRRAPEALGAVRPRKAPWRVEKRRAG